MQCNPLNYFLIIFLYLASSALCPSVFSEEINLDPVIVTSSRLGQLEFGKLRALDTINYKEIRSYPLYSLADILGYLPSVDVRKRGACGIQADLSIRGSNFEQTLILLDGISLNDTQTGHFNIDLPLTMFDIERIEVLKGQASSLYGPNAFAGVVNIITKKPQGRKFIYEYSRGEYNLSSHGAYLSFPIEDFCTGISYEYKQASGYKPETEFIQRNFYANTYRSLDNMELSLSGGVMDKDFGASTFYSNLFPREEEHIRTSFSRLELKGENFDTAFYYRRHWDNFLLDKTRPDWNENTHITSVYGGQFKNRRDMDWLNLAWGLDFAHDKITSTSLSCHSREREAFFLELGRIWEEKYIFNLGLREDYYSDWVGEFSPNLDLGYIVTQDLKLRYSLGRSFRVPSYTELYYRDAGNIGDANLICEHNLSWEIGLDKKQNFGLLGLTFFQRRTEDTIDWVRENNSQPWQAKNSGRILFEGIEFDCCPQNRENAVFSLSRFGYTYIESNRKSDSVASLSKYALDYLRHQFTLGIRNILPFDFIQNWNLSYKERVNSGKWFLLDSRISKAIFKNRVKYEIFLEGTNLTNANYKEITDVAMPGRWLAFGVRTEF